MFKIFDIPAEGQPTSLLAIMPMKTMSEVLGLAPAAQERIRNETKDGGICDLHLSYARPGFGQKVIVQRESDQ